MTNKLFRNWKKGVKIVWTVSLVGLLMLHPLYGIWRGKVIRPNTKENIWIYGNDKGKRTLSFIAFENITGDVSFDSFRTSIPKSIGETLQNFKLLKLPPEDSIPVLQNLNRYQIYSYTFDELGDVSEIDKVVAELTNFSASTTTETDEILETTTEDLEEAQDFEIEPSEVANPSKIKPSAPTVSNTNKEPTKREEFEKNLSKATFAYIVKDEKVGEYRQYHFIEEPSRYIDAHIATETALTETTIPLGTFPDGVRYFSLDTYRYKTLEIQNNLYYLNGTSLLTAIDKIPSDYVIYGAYEVKGVEVVVSLYLIYKHEKKIVHIFSKTLSSFKIGKELKDLAVHVVGYLEQREVISNIRIEANEEGALFSLGDKILGKIPLNIATLVEDNYRYEVFKPGYSFKGAKSELPLDGDTFSASASDKTIEFQLKENKESGELSLKVTNDVPVSFYINQELKAINTSRFIEKNLPADNYYVVLKGSEDYKRTFQLEVFPNTTTELSLSMAPDGIPPSKRNINYNLGARISAALGLTLLGAFFVSRLQTVGLEDRHRAVQLELQTASENDLQSSLSEQERSLSSQISSGEVRDYSILAGSLISLIVMTVMHTYDVLEERSSIETEISKEGDVKIIYNRKVSF